MVELFRTSNRIELNWALTVLHDAAIAAQVFDQNINIMEGNMAIFPQRLMVPSNKYQEARQILNEAYKNLPSKWEWEPFLFRGVSYRQEMKYFQRMKEEVKER